MHEGERISDCVDGLMYTPRNTQHTRAAVYIQRRQKEKKKIPHSRLLCRRRRRRYVLMADGLLYVHLFSFPFLSFTLSLSRFLSIFYLLCSFIIIRILNRGHYSFHAFCGYYCCNCCSCSCSCY